MYKTMANIRQISENPGYPEFVWNCHLTYKFRDDIVRTQAYDSGRDQVLKYAQEVKNGTIVEIGLLGGATILHLYDYCKENGNKIFGIDPFEKINIYNGAEAETVSENIKTGVKEWFTENRTKLEYVISKYNLDDVITIYNEESWTAYDKFEDSSINMLFVDGDHSMEGVYKDLKLFWPKVASGGIIIGDDYDWLSVRNGLDKFCKEYEVNFVAEGVRFIIRKP
jgi:hypothetical protein